jgi:hypothetical protein
MRLLHGPKLTGICVDHLQNFAKRHHLGFIAREAFGAQADQWLFTAGDLTVLVSLSALTVLQKLPECRRTGDDSLTMPSARWGIRVLRKG